MSKFLHEYLAVIFWSFIFAISCNLFIVPYGLYNGGIVGTSQLLRTFLTYKFGLNFNFDLAGIINLLINIPLLIVAYKEFNKHFVYKTIISVAVQTVAFSIKFSESIIHDQLMSIIIGGLVSGYAVSRILTHKSSGGGNDIVGMVLAKKKPGSTIGKYSFYYNIGVYTICALAFNLEIAIYSIFQSMVYSYMIDRGHLENRDVTLMIFTRVPEVKNVILSDNRRGVTAWDGRGAYTNKETEVLVSVVSKYEVEKIKRDIRRLDPDAFVIVTNIDNVTGGYEKRLV